MPGACFIVDRERKGLDMQDYDVFIVLAETKSLIKYGRLTYLCPQQPLSVYVENWRRYSRSFAGGSSVCTCACVNFIIIISFTIGHTYTRKSKKNMRQFSHKPM